MFQPLHLPRLAYVVRHMRRDDRREIFATRWRQDEQEFAQQLYEGTNFGQLALSHDGTPVAAFGAVEMWPGVWSVWLFATDDWPAVAAKVTRHLRRQFIPFILSKHAHRAECMAIADRPVVHRWLKYLGAQPEAVLRKYGKNQEDFILFSWEKKYVQRTI